MAQGKFARWFLGEDQSAEESTEAATSVEAEDVEVAPPESEPKPTPPGWYLTEGTLRYFDGTRWTENVAPPPRATLTASQIAGAVFAGILAALFVVWAGAQADPDHIYFPVKFVVEEVPDF